MSCLLLIIFIFGGEIKEKHMNTFKQFTLGVLAGLSANFLTNMNLVESLSFGYKNLI